MGEIIKKYEKVDITVVWKPKLCIHAAECVKRLPEVYNPDEKPWIKVENANADELIKQIDACPSGALTYESKIKSNMKESEKLRVDVLENGPILIHGDLIVKGSNGNEVEKTKTTAFCRCGASTNKPYCDGTHNKIGFKAD